MPIVNQLSIFSAFLAFAGTLYLLLGLHFWRSRRAEDMTASPSIRVLRWEKFLIGVAVVAHATGLHGALFGQNDMQFSFSLAFCLMAWFAALIYWLESFQVRLDGVQLVVLLLAAVAAFAPLAFPASHAVTHLHAPGFRLHFLAAMLAYGLFALAAAQALFMGALEKRLHRPGSSRFMQQMPPLLALEALLFRIINMAFILLTLALASGFLYSEEIFGKAFTFDHKTVFGILSWLIFAVLLSGRHLHGWRGRRAIRWTLAGFAALLLAYVGSRFVLEVLLDRA
jgi:ABC-type uncharacterized transport system permease subunit